MRRVLKKKAPSGIKKDEIAHLLGTFNEYLLRLSDRCRHNAEMSAGILWGHDIHTYVDIHNPFILSCRFFRCHHFGVEH